MTPTQAQIIDSKIAEWNAWYETLPTDLKTKLSIHDFKRLGDNFYRIFVLTAAAQADRAKETGICEDTLEMMDAVDRRAAAAQQDEWRNISDVVGQRQRDTQG